MDGVLGPKIGDAASLWNFTPSPGWTKEEVLALKLALEKFGIGRWVQIVDSGVLPGKLIQQLNGQTQRLLGQQSIAGEQRARVPSGMHTLANSCVAQCSRASTWTWTRCARTTRRSRVPTLCARAGSSSTAAVRSSSGPRFGGKARRWAAKASRAPAPRRRDGCCHQGAAAQGKPGQVRLPSCASEGMLRAPAVPHLLLLARRYGLSKEHIDAIVLPAPVKSAHATATMERQAQAGGHRAKGKAAAAPTATKLKLSLMTSDVETLTAGQKLALLHRLHQRLQFLQRLARPAPASAGQPAPPAAKPAGGRKRKADGAAPGKKSAPELMGDPEQHKLAQLVAFGYPRDKCQDALEESGGNLERAVEWLCSNLS